MADLSATFRRPFAQQVAALGLRLENLIGTSRWDEVSGLEHDRRFMVAGAMKADLLADLAEAVRKAAEDGTTQEEFRRDFRAAVERRGWHGWTGEGTARGEAWRTRVIYQTNVATSYAAGRRAQLIEGNFAFWVYRHGGSLHPRLHHLAWDGIALPPDHPFWVKHSPPNGWGCSCRIFGARNRAGILRVGGDPDKVLPDDWDAIDPRTATPKGIDKGWDHAPGASVSQLVSELAKKIAKLPPSIGSDLGQDVQPKVEAAWADWLARVRAGERNEETLVGTIRKDVMQALATRRVTPISAEITLRPGLIAGPKAARHELASDALEATDWLNLPARLRQPRAVLMDVDTGRLLYVLDGDQRVPQIAVDLDYRRKRDDPPINRVVSAFRPRMRDIRGRVRGGRLILLVGELQ